MAINYNNPGSSEADLIVANLKTKNPEIKGANEILMKQCWTQICNGIIAFNISDLVVTTKSNGLTELHGAGAKATIIDLPGTSI